MWLPILLGFSSVFCIFAAVICSVIFRFVRLLCNLKPLPIVSKSSTSFRRRRNAGKHKNNNSYDQKPEIEFQYAETYLKECEAGGGEQGGDSGDTSTLPLPHTCPVLNTAFNRNFSYHQVEAVPVSLNVAHTRVQKLAGDLSLLSNISEEPRTDHSDPATTSGQAEQLQPAARVGARKVPPPTLPKPRFHPAFLSTDP